MAFKIARSDSFLFPVLLHDIDDNGRHTSHQIKVRFKRLPTDEIEKFQTGGFDPVLYADCVSKANGDRDMAMIILAAELTQRGNGVRSSDERADELLTIMSGWEGVEDEWEEPAVVNGETTLVKKSAPMEFNRDNLICVLRAVKSAYTDIKEGYTQAVSGEAKRKN